MGSLFVVVVMAAIAVPIGWAAGDGWQATEPARAGATRCPAVMEWLGVEGDVEAAREVSGACRGPLQVALVVAGASLVIATFTMGIDRFYSHDAVT